MILIALTAEQAAFVRGEMDRAISHHTKMALDLGADMRTWREANAHAEKEMLARRVFEVLDAQPTAAARDVPASAGSAAS